MTPETHAPHAPTRSKEVPFKLNWHERIAMTVSLLLLLAGTAQWFIDPYSGDASASFAMGIAVGLYARVHYNERVLYCLLSALAGTGR